ncbi:MAG: cupin domain-containing protein [Defluviitaleaceae bacterium]|nr:cupin domain-containing protein [Defluviitaleaceae bacterium]
MIFENSNIEFERINEQVSRKILAHSGKMMAVEVHFKGKMTDYGIHSHEHEQIAYVVKGRFEFVVDGKKSVVVAGDSIYFAPNIPHGTILLDSEGILLDIFTPQREDFLGQ